MRRFKNLMKKSTSLVLVFAMLMGLCATGFAAGTNDHHHDHGEEAKVYVSLGDSMVNGYGLTGYETEDYEVNGFMMHAPESYPCRFADKYGFEHVPMAMSAMRAEDLHFILEFPYDNAEALAVAEMAEWNEEAWNAMFTTGDYYTWNEFCDGYRFHDYEGIKPEWTGTANVAKLYQDNVANADVISLGIGNANFGVFLLGRVFEAMSIMGGDPSETDPYQLERALAECDEETRAFVLSIYDELTAMIGDTEQAQTLVRVLTYGVLSYVLNYAGIIERIVELNGDAEIILVGLINTMYGMKITGDFGEVDLGAVLGSLIGTMNTYIAALPAAFQLAGKYEDATFYYAEASNVELIYTELSGELNDIVRDRIVDQMNDMVFNSEDGLLKGLDIETVASMNGKDVTVTLAVEEITLADVKAYEDGEALSANKQFTCALYLAFEQAIKDASKMDSLDVSAFTTLAGGLEGALGGVMGSLNPESMMTEDALNAVMADVMQKYAAWARSEGKEEVDALRSSTIKTQLQETVDEAETNYLTALHTAMREMLETFNETYEVFYYYSESIVTEYLKGDNFYDSVTGEVTKARDLYDQLTRSDNGLRGGMVRAIDSVMEQSAAEAFVDGALDEVWNTLWRNGYQELYEGMNAAYSEAVELLNADSNEMPGLTNIELLLLSTVNVSLDVWASEAAAKVLGPTLTTTIYESLVAEETVMSLLHLFGRMLVGNGIGAHPTATGHAALADAVIKAYGEKNTVDQEVSNRISIALDALAAIVAEYYDEAYELGYQYAAEYIAVANEALDYAYAELESIKALIDANSGEMTAEFKAELMNEFDTALATIEQVKTLINEADALDQATLDEALALLALLEQNLDTILNLMDIAIDDVSAAVYAELIARIEAFNNYVETEVIPAVEAAVRAAVDYAVAYLRDLVAKLEAAVEDLRDALIGHVDAQIEAVIERIEAAIAELKAAIADQVNMTVEQFEAAVKNAVKELSNAVIALIHTAQNNGEAWVNAVVEQFVAAIKNIYANATNGEYIMGEDSYYVAIGDASVAGDSYAALLADELGVAYNNIAAAGLSIADCASVLMANAADIAAADLITVGFSNNTMIDYMVAQMKAALLEQPTDEYDWTKYVGEEGTVYVEQALTELRAELTAMGLTPIELDEETTIDVVELMMVAIESYAYSYAGYLFGYPELIAAIREINADALIVSVGQNNGLKDLTLKQGENVLPIGEYVQYLIDAANAEALTIAMLTGETVFVDAPAVETIAEDTNSAITSSIFRFVLNVVLAENGTAPFYASADGHAYIAEQILNALTIGTEEHVHTEVIVPGYAATCTEDGLTDGVICATCGETLVAQEVIPAGHNWQVVWSAPACSPEGGFEHRMCYGCGAEEYIDLPHEPHPGYVLIPERPATCIDDGTVEHYKCTACDSYVTEDLEDAGYPASIPALGHTNDVEGDEDGLCDRCGFSHLVLSVETETTIAHYGDVVTYTVYLNGANTVAQGVAGGLFWLNLGSSYNPNFELVEGSFKALSDSGLEIAVDESTMGVAMAGTTACKDERVALVTFQLRVVKKTMGTASVNIPWNDDICLNIGVENGMDLYLNDGQFATEYMSNGRITIHKVSMTYDENGHWYGCAQDSDRDGVADCDVKIAYSEHTYGDWTVVTKPTCTEAGLETRSCECGYVQEQSIKALDHIDENEDGVCERCGHTALYLGVEVDNAEACVGSEVTFTVYLNGANTLVGGVKGAQFWLDIPANLTVVPGSFKSVTSGMTIAVDENMMGVALVAETAIADAKIALVTFKCTVNAIGTVNVGVAADEETLLNGADADYYLVDGTFDLVPVEFKALDHTDKNYDGKCDRCECEVAASTDLSLSIETETTDAFAGEEVTFVVYLNGADTLNGGVKGGQFWLDIPEYLTVVPGSFKAVENSGLDIAVDEKLMGVAMAASKGVTDAKIALVTFKCTVDNSVVDAAAATVGFAIDADTCVNGDVVDYWMVDNTLLLRSAEFTTHAHTGKWVYDEENHWHVCDCGLVTDKAAHSFEITTIEPTCKENGLMTYTCGCGYTYSVELEGGHIDEDEDGNCDRCDRDLDAFENVSLSIETETTIVRAGDVITFTVYLNGADTVEGGVWGGNFWMNIPEGLTLVPGSFVAANSGLTVAVNESTMGVAMAGTAGVTGAEVALATFKCTVDADLADGDVLNVTFIADENTCLDGKIHTYYFVEDTFQMVNSELTFTTAPAGYTISFVAGEHGNGEMASVLAVGTYVLPECGFTGADSKAAIKFKGWEINGKTYKAGEEITINADTVITAVWYMVGDVNNDWMVSSTDTNLIFRYASGVLSLTEDQLLAANANGDALVNSTDTNLVFRFVSGTLATLG